jgi:hypothetical protein
MFTFRSRKSKADQSRQDFEFEYLLFLASAFQAAERQPMIDSDTLKCEFQCNEQSESVVANTARETSS